MTNVTNNRTIAKNTLLLYFRMIFSMVISLYTSRVILQILGISDFGLYQVVGGVVGMLAFLNGALSTGSSRFLTFELGTNNWEKLKQTFSATLTLHICIAIVIILLAETVGLWFLCYKLSIPVERLNAALWVYHLSILTTAVSIIQVPYNAIIISHEKMGVYAYMSIIEVTAKLGIVYILGIGVADKLKLYAVLLCIIQILIACFYTYYCISRFKETRYRFLIDKEILKPIIRFSGWSLFSNLSIALNSQGTTIITNIFFNPSVVAARAISGQVSMAVNQFVNNFRTAVNPQIVKQYAAGDYASSQKLLLDSTKYSFFLMYLLGLPIILLASPLLKLWLGVVPEYTVIFLQLIIVQSMFSVFDVSFYTALYAKGKLRENALISPLVGFLQFPVVYYLFKMGYSPVTLSYLGILSSVLLGIVIKPILLVRVVGYSFSDIFKVLLCCLKVVVCSTLLPLLCFGFNASEGVLHFLLIGSVSVLSVCICVLYIGISKELRQLLLNRFKTYFPIKK